MLLVFDDEGPLLHVANLTQLGSGSATRSVTHSRRCSTILAEKQECRTRCKLEGESNEQRHREKVDLFIQYD